MSSADVKANRPLSPHLSIYRWSLTFLMSGFHRVTGIVLYFGFLLLVWWLVAAASGPGAFDFVNWVLGSWLGLLVLFGFSWGLIHHTLGGLRHFVWDFGVGLGEPARDRLALATIVGSVTLTLVLWAIGLWIR
ncbi:MAG: succinate dehydrogenase, cytochrome b556 subunit [Bauldia sp.]|nr:succinate dehydrogenase, cytochrome b556 subunit [Bauldia sp.]